MGSNNDSSSDEDDEPEVISRKEWEARPPLRVRRFPQPPTTAQYSETETKSCSTREECTQLVQDIQSYHMDVRGLPDIQYHFLIGGDGHVYEGRGWEYVGSTIPQGQRTPGETNVNLIEIAFIGTYTDNSPPKKMMKLAAALIMSGINQNKLIITRRKDGPMSQEEVDELRKEGPVTILGHDPSKALELEDLLDQGKEKSNKSKKTK